MNLKIGKLEWWDEKTLTQITEETLIDFLSNSNHVLQYEWLDREILDIHFHNNLRLNVYISEYSHSFSKMRGEIKIRCAFDSKVSYWEDLYSNPIFCYCLEDFADIIDKLNALPNDTLFDRDILVNIQSQEAKDIAKMFEFIKNREEFNRQMALINELFRFLNIYQDQ